MGIDTSVKWLFFIAHNPALPSITIVIEGYHMIVLVD